MKNILPQGTLLIERGFDSKLDAVPCWVAWMVNGKKRVTFRCICGLERPIKYREEQEYSHKRWACGFRATIRLVGFRELNETKAERKARRDENTN